MTRTERIRNFAIIAHIDHGKSTLADRILQQTGAVADRDMKAQLLDSMDIERERGITIKAQTATIEYTAKDGITYILNPIDTPDTLIFRTKSVVRYRPAAILVVDAAQGVEAQTLANVYLAIDNDLEILPVINKVDLPSADPDEVIRQIEEGIGLEASGAVLCSAKTGLGIDELLEAIVEQFPSPDADDQQPLCALVVDSWFDTYVGVVMLVRVVDGEPERAKIKLMATKANYEVTKLGVFTPHAEVRKELRAGEVGFVIASIKSLRDARVGDTVTTFLARRGRSSSGFSRHQTDGVFWNLPNRIG